MFSFAVPFLFLSVFFFLFRIRAFEGFSPQQSFFLLAFGLSPDACTYFFSIISRGRALFSPLVIVFIF